MRLPKGYTVHTRSPPLVPLRAPPPRNPCTPGAAVSAGRRYGTTAVCALRVCNTVYVAHAGVFAWWCRWVGEGVRIGLPGAPSASCRACPLLQATRGRCSVVVTTPCASPRHAAPRAVQLTSWPCGGQSPAQHNAQPPLLHTLPSSPPPRTTSRLTTGRRSALRWQVWMAGQSAQALALSQHPPWLLPPSRGGFGGSSPQIPARFCHR